jgi:hypothetical protein
MAANDAKSVCCSHSRFSASAIAFFLLVIPQGSALPIARRARYNNHNKDMLAYGLQTLHVPTRKDKE